MLEIIFLKSQFTTWAVTPLDVSTFLVDCVSGPFRDWEELLVNEPLARTFFNRWCRFFRFVPFEEFAVEEPSDGGRSGKVVKYLYLYGKSRNLSG